MKKLWTILRLIILAIVIYIAVNVLLICSYTKVDDTRHCDVAIVLGAATYNDGVSKVYEERLNHAIELYDGKYVDRIIATGGTAEGNMHSDAYMAGIYLKEAGCPDEAVILEESSAITAENLANAEDIMNANGWQTALIVSDPLHMRRSMLLAKDSGIQAYASPTQTSAYHSIKTKLPFLARETFFYIGYQIYRLLPLRS